MRWGESFRRGRLEDSIAVGGDDVELARRLDALERAHQAELTVSTSLNIRGTALGAASAVAVLLLAQFSAEWLDDGHWEFDKTLEWVMRYVLLPVSVVALVLCMLLALIAVRPRREWGGEFKERLERIGEPETDAEEARLLLAMVDHQRVTNERKARLLQIAYWPLGIAILATVAQSMIFAFDAQSKDAPRRTGPGPVAERPLTGLPTADQGVELAARYAPRVYVHEDEEFGPADPADFIAASRLGWNRVRHDTEIAGRGEVDPARLGARCSEATGGCYEYSGYLSRELTRPGTARPERPLDLQANPDRGFFLDPAPSVRAGDGSVVPEAPVFYEFRPTNAGVALTYWFFYAYSQPRVGAALRETLGEKISHEGDWESIDVVLSDDFTEPKAVYFYGHGQPKRRRWAEVCKLVKRAQDCRSQLPGHPVVYSALGSHASYPDPASTETCGPAGCACDRRSPGREWDAWRVAGGLRPVEREPWYGFGGAWGAVGDFDAGPLGPSVWKLPGTLDLEARGERAKPC